MSENTGGEKEAFLNFIQEGQDRCRFICDYLEKGGVKSSVLHINGKKHILINFPKECYNGYFRIKTIIAHYDRVPQSPGANDNSFAVFTLMKWAITLNQQPCEHNIRLIFTDGEEISSAAEKKEGQKSILEEQGAYDLAGVFKRLGITGDDVFVFDCMGRGTVPVLGKPFILEKAHSSFKKRYNELQERAKEILSKASPSAWLNLPVSLSDNAGFIASGIPAVVITMLPQEEASKYMFNLVKYPPLEAFITNKVLPQGWEAKTMLSLIPKTWLYLHSTYDNMESLSWESQAVFMNILNVIRDLKLIFL